MPSAGRGRSLLEPFDEAGLLPRPDAPGSPTYAANSGYFWGAQPQPVTTIPYAWLSPPVTFRPDQPINTVLVTRTGAGTARSFDQASATEFGVTARSFTLASAIDADPASLAAYMDSYYATQPGQVPRQRIPALALVLNSRTTAEQQKILARQIGNRIFIDGAPAQWPVGTTSLIIQGIRHSISQARVVVWNTTPVIGTSPGVPGPWFRADGSLADGSDVSPF